MPLVFQSIFVHWFGHLVFGRFLFGHPAPVFWSCFAFFRHHMWLCLHNLNYWLTFLPTFFLRSFDVLSKTSNCPIMKTYGDKPIVFRFENEEEFYMIGSEVGNHLRLFRGALYKRFPGLTRRNLNNDLRKKLVDMGHSQHVSASSITLLVRTILFNWFCHLFYK